MTSTIKSIGSKMLVLSEKDVRRCLSMADCLAINRKAVMSISDAASQAGGKGNVPSRLALPGPPRATNSGDAPDCTLFKPAAFYGNDDSATCLMGMKIISLRSQNPKQGFPLAPATIMVLDADTGVVQAVMDGTHLTGCRTAASSGLATQLARPDAQTLVVFGAGLQAEMHVDAIQSAIGREIPSITIVNRSRDRAEKLAQKLSESSSSSSTVNVVLLEDKAGVEKALSTADVIAATTNTTTPLFDGSVLPPGCHINGIGSYTPEMQEIGPSAVDRCRILIDTPEAKNVGDLKHLVDKPDHPMQLLGDLLGDPSSLTPASGAYDCTFYKGVGTAIQDVMTADLVMKKARELGIGTEVDMS